MELKRDFTLAELNALIDIYSCANPSKTNWSAICKELGIFESNPIYRRVFLYLKSIGCIEVIEKIGNIKYLKIDVYKLCATIDQQLIVNNLVDRYLKREHFFIW
jgi:hypothetical protein